MVSRRRNSDVSSDEETQVKTEWVRSQKLDKTKRSAKKGGEVTRENVITGVRKRKNVNYKDLELGKKPRAIKRASVNTADKRSTRPRTRNQNTKKGSRKD